MRFAGDLMQQLHQLAAASVVGPVIRGRQIRHGKLVYDNVPDVWQAAVDWTIEGGLPLTPANIRQSAEAIMAQRETMIEDDLGINYDELGHRLVDEAREARFVPVVEARSGLSTADLAAMEDPTFPF